jgi:hypothetical protein
MMNAQEAWDAQRALGPLLKGTREEREAERVRRSAATQVILQEFKQYLYVEHGLNLNEKQHNLVYAKAWEDGHAHGYSEVENHYIELAHFAREILDS